MSTEGKIEVQYGGDDQAYYAHILIRIGTNEQRFFVSGGDRRTVRKQVQGILTAELRKLGTTPS